MVAINRNKITNDTNKGKAILDLEDRVITSESRLDTLEGTDQATGGPTVVAELSMDTTSPATATAGRGVVLGTGNEGLVAQLAVAAMAVRVQTAGVALNNQGAEIVLPTSTSLAIATADATNGRKDIVVLTKTGTLAVRTGTPAGSPADPTLTAGDVPLARVTVAALAASILTANIADLRSRGGVSGANLTAGSVPPTKLSFAGRKTGLFIGKNGTGAITLTGAAVGDRVVDATEIALASDDLVEDGGAVTTQPNALFQTAITVADQIQQVSASDLSGKKYYVTLAPAAS